MKHKLTIKVGGQSTSDVISALRATINNFVEHQEYADDRETRRDAWLGGDDWTVYMVVTKGKEQESDG